ncbi:MAG: Trm112 family protein [Propioniciclava sp.]|uniref:Trm112 family protein n=1 Tax=Propioniciclava sp. TaxID=2038686 RepID=UPI0039E3E47B
MSDLIPGVLELLVCPACHGKLTWDYEASELVCTEIACGLAYPVRGGIPILVIDEARAPEEG